MPLPVPDLDTKQFDHFFEESKAVLPSLSPEWTDYNISDPGITTLELFSWLGDINMYRLNRVDKKHLLKYLKLLNALPKPVIPAKVWVTFQTTEAVKIPKGTKLTAKLQEKNLYVPFSTKKDINLSPVMLSAVTVKNERGVIHYTEAAFPYFFYPFGEKTKKGNYFELSFSAEFTDDFALTFILYEENLPPVGKHSEETPCVIPSAFLKWEYQNGTKWEKLNLNEDETNAFSKSGTIYFKKPENENKLNSIRCTLEQYHFENAPKILKILTNTTQAVQIESKQFTANGTGFPNQKISLEHMHVLNIKEVKVNGSSWTETDVLEEHDYKSQVYLLEHNSGVITFGDNIHGQALPNNALVEVYYSISKGAQGNIQENSCWSCDEIAQNITIQNSFPAAGGQNSQTIEEAFIAFKKEMQISSQAVTAGDFEYLAIHTPGIRVARAKALPCPDENKVEVIVVPFSMQNRPYPTENFLQTVCRHLDKHRLLTTKVETTPPKYALISISAELKIKAHESPENVKKCAIKVLDTFLDPIRGWKDQEGWPFGQTVYKSDIYTLLENVEGVVCVFNLYLKAEGAYKAYQNGNILLYEYALAASSARHNISFTSTFQECRSVT